MLQKFIGASMGATYLSYYLSKQKADALGYKKAYLASAAALNPHFDKRFKKGEDAYLIDKGNRFICVLDGVGGWASEGICSGKMTKELIGHIEQVFNTWDLDNRRRSLHSVLDKAVGYVKNKGSTTAVLAELSPTFDWNDEEVTLKTCNLGDSGYMIFRPSERGSRFIF